MAPASLVAPLREVGIVLVTFLGARYLLEADVARRLVSATLIAAGIVGMVLVSRAGTALDIDGDSRAGCGWRGRGHSRQ